ncbi:MAG: cell division protein FtsH, partial [Hyphomicrobiales bacterium]|nr:cell division protein FtsH [Hyphomicrobiales bacterium]
DSTGGEVVRRLRRVRAKKALPANLDRTPKLEEIPLCRSVRAWANQMIDDLRRVDAGKITPAELPGVVLEGPPGVGKTLIASALAKSAGWQFLSTSVGDWFGSSDGHLGGVSKACTRFFDELLAGERVIGLIDEIDALPDRASLDAKDLQWWNSIITLMLLQIDRIRKSGKPILLLGATNYFSRLDAALVRPGRLEQRVPVLPATSQAEIAALFAHFLSSELGPESVTQATRLAGQATPAAVEAWVRGARARARTENRALVEEDLLLAIAPPDERAPGILRIAALHEAGHALVAKRLGIAVTEVSIIAQGQMGGVTRTQPVSMFPTRQDVQDMATTLLAGRAADLVLNGGAHAGAQADLAMATKLLADAMAAWGLYDTLVDTSPALGGSTRLSPALAQAVNLELKRLLKRAVTMVEAEPALVHRLADALLRQRVLGAAEIEQIIQTEPLRKVPDATPDPVVGTANPGVPKC